MQREGKSFCRLPHRFGLPEVSSESTEDRVNRYCGNSQLFKWRKSKNILDLKILLHTCNCPVLWFREHGVFLGFLLRQRLHTRLIVLNSHCFLGFSPLVYVSSGI